MDPAISQHVFNIVVEFLVLVFSLSFHEFAHAWTASRFGDPTARMLGRVTLNPAKHIDPIGTIAVPLISLIGFGGLLFGWAKPTPVTTRNLRNLKRSYPLIVLAGPASNLLLAILAVIALFVVNRLVPGGHACVLAMLNGEGSAELMGAAPVLLPITMILYSALLMNFVLTVFNLIPLPPLDGSLLMRHWLPYGVSAFYDRIGYFGLFLTFFAGRYILPIFVGPAMAISIGIILGQGS